MPVIIRNVVKEDMQQIFDMQNELTDYVVNNLGEIGAMELTVEDLIRDSGLDPNQPQAPLLRTFIAEKRLNNATNPVGFASFANTYSTWMGKTLYLMCLYVKESHRHEGIGTQLICDLVRYAKETGCNRVYSHFNKNNPNTNFFKSLGAVDLTETEDWLLYVWHANE